MTILAWGLAATALACLAVLAAVAARIVRERGQLRRALSTKDGEIERLHDRVWQLAEGEERTRGLVEAQVDLIVQRDAHGRITFANERFAALLGQAREDLIGSDATLSVLERGPAATAPGGGRRIEEAVATADGPRWIEWIETPAIDAAGRPGTLRAGRDMTDRITLERSLAESRSKAEAASDAKSRFIATVSHEFRTPLNGILGMAELILDTRLSPEQTTYVRAIKTSGEALLTLIDEILDFSKIEAGRLDLAAEPFDLQPVVEGVVELLGPKAQGKGIEVAAYIAPDVPRKLLGDGDRLRQVLVNLAGNAVKFTDTGGVGIVVERAADGAIELAVRDTGPGIAPERLPALFGEFEQGDDSATRRHGGTGLGLAITRRIVEGMGGEIRVETAPGQGSAFMARLPLPEADASRPRPSVPRAMAGKDVLILARSPFEAPFLARRLREAGAVVTLTGDPVDALARVAVAPCDLLIADCALGLEIVREVGHEARQAGVARTIVLLSPYDRRDFGAPTAAGFDGYLVKPVRPRSLYERLARSKGEPMQEPGPSRLPGPRRRRPETTARVLLAEDNDINALLALKSLEKLGAIVDWAKNGEEALALTEASFSGVRPAYDLVLMDIRMPVLDGLEATRRIRRLEEALGRREPSRIVALTANAGKEDEVATTEAGFDGLLAKPFEFQALSGLLESARPALAKAS
ncbi:MAG TPA: ATP-binding protein [Beijerinckiaceae bacterium]|jgi:PAS domain S-box-containing protein